MNEKEFRTLFSGFCCSQCRNDFDLGDLVIKNQNNDLMQCTLKCHKCGKDFGDILLNYTKSAKSHAPLEVIEGLPPISIDDVLDAHEFIKKNL